MTREELKKFEPLWDKWYIQEHLGGGSFGDVYRITCQVYERTYEAALKVISIPRDQSELNEVELNCETKEETISYYDRIRQNITSEIDMMEQLKGRTNIVSFEDHDIIPHNQGKDPGYDIFIRMELLKDFGSFIGQESKQWQDNRQIVKLGMDIAEGLRVCHSHNIIHRDIKLSNIFRSSDGDYKIGDFGIARNVSDAQLTMSIKGTFNYMAPEVYNREHYDFRADVYSLGLVMYHLLNKNRGPFLPLTEVPTAEQKENALFRRMRGDKMQAPLMAGEKLANIVLKACEFRPEDRFQCMEELIRELYQLTAEDMKRPDQFISVQENFHIHGEEANSNDNETVAFVQDPDLKNQEEQAVLAADEEDDDERTMAMVEFNTPVNSKELAEDSLALENEKTVQMETAPERKELPRERAHSRKGLYFVAAGVVMAVFCICVIFAMTNIIQKHPVSVDDIGQEESNDISEWDDLEVNEKNGQEETEKTELEDEVIAQEETRPVVPYCKKGVLVKGRKKSGGLVFEGDHFENLKIQGDFQVSETDETEVEGSLVLEHTEDVIKESGDYAWTFTPEDMEHYEVVTGTVHITAIHKEPINGIEELKRIRDKAAVYQLLLTDCGLEDLVMLKGMTNLAALDISNNMVTDISALADCPNLQQVYLDGNSQVRDIKPLFGLKKLQMLGLSGTAVSDEDINKLKKCIDVEVLQ